MAFSFFPPRRAEDYGCWWAVPRGEPFGSQLCAVTRVTGTILSMQTQKAIALHEVSKPTFKAALWIQSSFWLGYLLSDRPSLKLHVKKCILSHGYQTNIWFYIHNKCTRLVYITDNKSPTILDYCSKSRCPCIKLGLPPDKTTILNIAYTGAV